MATTKRRQTTASQKRAQFFNRFFRRHPTSFANVYISAHPHFGCMLKVKKDIRRGQRVADDFVIFRGPFGPHQYTCDACGHVHEIPVKGVRNRRKETKDIRPICAFFDDFIYTMYPAIEYVANMTHEQAGRCKVVLQYLFAKIHPRMPKRAKERWSLFEQLYANTSVLRKGRRFPPRLLKLIPDQFGATEELCTWAQSAFDTNVVSNWEEGKGDCLYLLTSLTTHSCDPNADLLDSRRKRTDVVMTDQFLEATEPLKKGDTLTIAYFGSEKFANGHIRRRYLKASWGFWCACRQCAAEEASKKGRKVKAASSRKRKAQKGSKVKAASSRKRKAKKGGKVKGASSRKRKAKKTGRRGS